MRSLLFILFACAFILAFAFSSSAQSGRPTPTPTPTPTEQEPEPVKVYTEEVRLPVFAYDEYGHFDPSLELSDILVLEDNVQQQVRSIRRVPASILLLLDMNNQLTLAKSSATTRDIAMHLVSSLNPGDELAIMQYGDKVDFLQDWTTDKEAVRRVLKTKLYSTKNARFADAIAAASDKLKDKSAGSRHVVIITDGLNTPGGKVNYADAVKELMAAQATVHVISYTALVRKSIENWSKGGSTRGGDGVVRQGIPSGDPTMPPPIITNPTYRIATITFDPAMKRYYKKYEADTRESEQRLASLAQETGGQILLPTSQEEIVKQGNEVARDIGAQYVVTYTPKRPLAGGKPGEYRHVEVAARRTGLHLRTRRGYIVTATP